MWAPYQTFICIDFVKRNLYLSGFTGSSTDTDVTNCLSWVFKAPPGICLTGSFHMKRTFFGMTNYFFMGQKLRVFNSNRQYFVFSWAVLICYMRVHSVLHTPPTDLSACLSWLFKAPCRCLLDKVSSSSFAKMVFLSPVQLFFVLIFIKCMMWWHTVLV